MKREKSLYSVFCIVATISILVVTAFFLPWGQDQSLLFPLWNGRVISSILSAVGFVYISFSVSYVNLRCFSYSSHSLLLYGTYLMVVLSISHCWEFSEYHLATMALIWSIMYQFKFLVYEKLKYSHLFQAIFYMSIAAVLVPQLLLYLLVFILSSFGRRDHLFSKTLPTIFGAMTIPVIYLVALSFLLDGPSTGELVAQYWDKLSDIAPTLSSLSVTGLFYYGLLLLIAIRSMIHFKAVSVQRNRAQRVSINLSLTLSIVSLILFSLYFDPDKLLLAIPLFIPFTFSIFDYFKNGNRSEVNVVFTLLFVMTIFYRVSLVLGL